MRGVWLRAVVASIIVWVLTSQSSAGIKDYCDSFARDAAFRKTGYGETAGTIGTPATDASNVAASPPDADANWHAAYEMSFTTCLRHHGSSEILAAQFTPRPKAARHAPAKVAQVRAPVAKIRKPVKVAEQNAVPNRQPQVRRSAPKKVVRLAAKTKSNPAVGQRKSVAASVSNKAEPAADVKSSSIVAARPRQPAKEQQSQNTEPCTNLLCWLHQARHTNPSHTALP